MIVLIGTADGNTSSGPWVYDPIQSGSVGTNPQLLRDFNVGSGSSTARPFEAFLDGLVYFPANDSTTTPGLELWA